MARKTVSDDFKVFSERLSDLMKERGLKQQDLADVLGIKRQTVSLYMTGQSMPDAEQVKNIAMFFSVSADWLLGLSNTKTLDLNIKLVCEFLGLSENVVIALKKVKCSEILSEFSKDPDLELHVFPADGLSEIFASDSFFRAALFVSKSISYRCVSKRANEQKNIETGEINIENPVGDILTKRLKLQGQAQDVGMAALSALVASDFYASEAAREFRTSIENLAELVSNDFIK